MEKEVDMSSVELTRAEKKQAVVNTVIDLTLVLAASLLVVSLVI